jgi:hypothetical protein
MILSETRWKSARSQKQVIKDLELKRHRASFDALIIRKPICGHAGDYRVAARGCRAAPAAVLE